MNQIDEHIVFKPKSNSDIFERKIKIFMQAFLKLGAKNTTETVKIHYDFEGSQH